MYKVLVKCLNVNMEKASVELYRLAFVRQILYRRCNHAQEMFVFVDFNNFDLI